MTYLLKLTLLLFAANVAANATQDPPRIYEDKAEQILSSASEILKGHESLFISFNYQVLDSDGYIDQEMEGKLYTTGDKYYMETGGNHFISNGEYVWVFMEGINEVHISLAEDTEGAITPTSLLENFARDYRSKWMRSELIEGTQVHIIDLVPVEPEVFFKYRIALGEDDFQIYYSEAHDRQGGIYRYVVTEYKPGKEIPVSRFEFRPEDHPGIEVVDLR
ncbi:MAG: outer membrane lipoprotein carrier protein LolA [Bacteroidia bacterium]|nr:MAG: outer membrane lipoprotein carrier protein LolA [Bacteroidia bacterium]